METAVLNGKRRTTKFWNKQFPNRVRLDPNRMRWSCCRVVGTVTRGRNKGKAKIEYIKWTFDKSLDHGAIRKKVIDKSKVI